MRPSRPPQQHQQESRKHEVFECTYQRGVNGEVIKRTMIPPGMHGEGQPREGTSAANVHGSAMAPPYGPDLRGGADPRNNGEGPRAKGTKS